MLVKLTKKDNEYLEKLAEFLVDIAIEDITKKNQQDKSISNSSKT